MIEQKEKVLQIFDCYERGRRRIFFCLFLVYRIANEVMKKNSMEIRNYKDKEILGGDEKKF